MNNLMVLQVELNGSLYYLHLICLFKCSLSDHFILYEIFQYGYYYSVVVFNLFIDLIHYFTFSGFTIILIGFIKFSKLKLYLKINLHYLYLYPYDRWDNSNMFIFKLKLLNMKHIYNENINFEIKDFD